MVSKDNSRTTRHLGFRRTKKHQKEPPLPSPTSRAPPSPSCRRESFFPTFRRSFAIAFRRLPLLESPLSRMYAHAYTSQFLKDDSFSFSLLEHGCGTCQARGDSEGLTGAGGGGRERRSSSPQSQSPGGGDWITAIGRFFWCNLKPRNHTPENERELRKTTALQTGSRLEF